jgi:hypothetical protein
MRHVTEDLGAHDPRRLSKRRLEVLLACGLLAVGVAVSVPVHMTPTASIAPSPAMGHGAHIPPTTKPNAPVATPTTRAPVATAPGGPATTVPTVTSGPGPTSPKVHRR